MVAPFRPGVTVWVPKTYATWVDVLGARVGFIPVSGGWKAGQGVG